MTSPCISRGVRGWGAKVGPRIVGAPGADNDPEREPESSGYERRVRRDAARRCPLPAIARPAVADGPASTGPSTGRVDFGCCCTPKSPSSRKRGLPRFLWGTSRQESCKV